MNKRKKNSATSIEERLATLPEEFSHFGEVYANEIQPVLAEKEGERQAAMGKAKTMGILGVVLAVAIAVGGLMLFKSIFAVFVAVVVGLGLITYGMSGVNDLMKQAKEAMVTPIANQFGLSFDPLAGGNASANLTACKAHKVVPSWDRAKLQDEITGDRNGVPFEFFEAHLEDKRTTTDSNGRTSTTWVTVFKGQCWVINAPKTFHGVTRVARDSGVFNALGALGSNISRAKLESPDFEKAFEVYTTDQVESRYLLTPDVMQAFLDLERVYKGKKLRATFEGNKIYVAIEGGDLFEPGSMFSSLDDPNRVGDLLEDIATVFHLVDVLGN